MEFEFDREKSAANLAKHGIDFVAAQALWRARKLVIVRARLVEDEERMAAFGLLDGRLWTAIFVRRQQRIRLISVRRSRKDEAEHYEQAQGNPADHGRGV